MNLFMLTWDPTVGWQTIISTVLFIGALLAIFTQRGKDLEGVRNSQKVQDETVRHISATLVELSKQQTELTKAHIDLAKDYAETKGVVKMLTAKIKA